VIKPDDPRRLAVDLLPRSTCHVRVAAVLADRHGIFGWGWNHTGFDGFGEHAEAAAIRRSNKRRLAEAALYVCAVRRKSGNVITAKPCEMCQKIIRQVGRVVYRDYDGRWIQL
jgi:tRNA(Arg) A34 adenosine deaminase TadA